MNLFLVGITSSSGAHAGRAARELSAFVADLPYYGDSGIVRSWDAPSGNVTAAAIQHPIDTVGGVEYARFEPGRFALFAGRPILWVADQEADGRSVLDPALYLDAGDELFDRLDGRFTVVRYDDTRGELAVVTDPLGLYPVYTTRSDGSRWFSNNATLLRDVCGSHAFRVEAAAGFLAYGWAIGGAPLWSAVDRLARGRTLRVRRGADDAVRDRYSGVVAGLLSAASRRPEAPEEAAGITAAGFQALSDWPGRTNVIGLSGGRDSRLVLAASVRAGVDCPTRTVAFQRQPGFPETADVRVARALATATDRAHIAILEATADDTAGWLARLVKMTPGTVSASIVGVVGPPPPGEPLELLHSGQNGEWLRLYYGVGASTPVQVADATLARFSPRFPRPSLNNEGMAIARELMHGYFRRASADGIRTADLPFYFAVDEDVPHFGPPAHGVYEFRQDTTFALCLGRLLPTVAGQSSAERNSGAFASRMLECLAPSLTGIPYADSDGLARWTFVPRRVNDLAIAGGKVAAELRRRSRAMVSHRRGLKADDPLVAMQADVRNRLSSPGHAMWQILDRKRVERLLTRDPDTFDPRTRRHIGALASIIVDGQESPAR